MFQRTAAQKQALRAEQQQVAVTATTLLNSSVWKGVFLVNNAAFVHTVNLSIRYEKPEEEQNFQRSMTSFFSVMEKYPAAQKDFLELLDEGRVEGLFNMVNLNAKPTLENLFLPNFYQLHTPGHCKELESDTEKRLLRNEQLKERPAFVRAFYIQLARMAAAWHDNKLGVGVPINELLSAQLFVKDLRERLVRFRRKHADSPSSPLLPALASLDSQLELLGHKLIVDPTILVFAYTGAGLSAHALEHYLGQFAAALGIERKNQGGHMHILRIAAEALMTGDTKRARLLHVHSEEQLLLNALAAFPKPLQQTIHDFLDFAKKLKTDLPLDPASIESYFVSLCKNLGIFPEENVPAGFAPPSFVNKQAYLTKRQHQFYTEIFEELRAQGLQHSPHHMSHYGDLLLLFLNTKSKNQNPSKEKSNVQREMEFAFLMENNNYASFLGLFNLYCNKLTSNELHHFSYALFLLASHFQPGHQMLLADVKFQQKLRDSLQQQQNKIIQLQNEERALSAQLESLRKHLQEPTKPSNPRKAETAKTLSTPDILESLEEEFANSFTSPEEAILDLSSEWARLLRRLNKAKQQALHLEGKVETYKERPFLLEQPLSQSKTQPNLSRN